MTVGFNTVYPKQTSINFTIQNTTPDKRTIKVFNTRVAYGNTLDLMQNPEVSEADIRHSLIKGELADHIRNGNITVVSTSIDLQQFDAQQEQFINNAGAALGVSTLFGEISVQDATASQTLTTQNTYYLINQWTTNQNNFGVTPNFSAGTLTIVYTGWYLINCTCSMQSANNLTFKAALFINGSIHVNGKVQFSTSGISGTPTINFTIGDINKLNAGDVMDIRVTCTTGSNIQFSVLQANFFAAQM